MEWREEGDVMKYKAEEAAIDLLEVTCVDNSNEDYGKGL